jgi:digeranylgeranylglycerophospholipid reductase
VLERKKTPGSGMHTTGILVKEAAQLLAPPEHMIRRITEVCLHSPSMKELRLVSPGYFFLATDTPALMQHMSAQAQAAGVDLRLAAPFESAVEQADGLYLPRYDLRCRFLIGADGARSRVAAQFNLGLNRHFLIGSEAEFDGADEQARAFHCFLSRKFAPGYIGWAVPGVGITQAGLAVARPHRPELMPFIRHISAVAGLGGRRIIARRGGLIPAGGLVKPFMRGNVLLLGDAAGIVSPLTGGGIHTSLHYGSLLGEKLADHLLAGAPHPAAWLSHAYPRFHLKRLQRIIFEHAMRDALADAVIENPLFRRLSEAVFFRAARLADG